MTNSHGANAKLAAFVPGLTPAVRPRFEAVLEAVIAGAGPQEVDDYVNRELALRHRVVNGYVEDAFGIKDPMFEPDIEDRVDFLLLVGLDLLPPENAK